MILVDVWLFKDPDPGARKFQEPMDPDLQYYNKRTWKFDWYWSNHWRSWGWWIHPSGVVANHLRRGPADNNVLYAIWW